MKILDVKTKQRAIGNLGEKFAAKHLKRLGYKILEKNFVAEGHEIDIIAQNKHETVFVEVKTRSVGKYGEAETRPAASVTPAKQRKIIEAARIYAAYNSTDKQLRFDVIEVFVEKNKLSKINHMEGAFNCNTAQK